VGLFEDNILSDADRIGKLTPIFPAISAL